jgi:hypothetical protein
MNTKTKKSKIGRYHATFSGDEYMFISWMYRERPDFDYKYVRSDDAFTILFDGDDAFANEILAFIREQGYYTLLNKNWR